MDNSLLFIDRCCPKPYDPITLFSGGMGGTEASVVRIAECLAECLTGVRVEQVGRIGDSPSKALYTPMDETPHATHVVCLRNPLDLVEARQRFPRSKLYLWAHDLASPEWARQWRIVADTRATVVCVSQFHRQQTLTALRAQGYSGEFPVRVIHNPIDDTLKPDSTPVDPLKLTWFSSPHKGLDYALTLFKNLRNFNTDFRLHVANPGYCPDGTFSDSGVIPLGSLRHSEVLDHVRSSLCVFYPGTNFPETFGLVFAEADAVGTPVIAHSHGAAAEVLDHPAETLDCRNPRAVIDRVLSWHSGNRPIVRGREIFRTSNVAKDWIRLLNA